MVNECIEVFPCILRVFGTVDVVKKNRLLTLKYFIMPTKNSSKQNSNPNQQSGKSSSNNKNMNGGKMNNMKSPGAHDKAAGMDEKRRNISDSNGL